MKHIVVSALLLSLATAASAQTPAQTKVMDNLNLARAIAEVCPNLKLNTVVAAMALTHYKIDIGEGDRHFDAFVASYRKAKEAVEEMSPDAVCAFGMLTYGPKGSTLKGLLSND